MKKLKIVSSQGRYGYANCPEGVKSNIGAGQFNAGEPLLRVLFANAQAAADAVGKEVEIKYAGRNTDGTENIQVSGAVKARNLERKVAQYGAAFQDASIFKQAAAEYGIELTREEILAQAEKALVRQREAAANRPKLTMSVTGGSIFNLNEPVSEKKSAGAMDDN